MTRYCKLLLVFSMQVALPMQATAVEPTLVEEARYQDLIGQLRCLVCQNQTIAESNAPLAQDLRRQVQEMLQAGRSDAEIMLYLTDRYGDFVLYKPPMKPTTWVLWLGPFVLLGLALLVAFIVFRHSRRPMSDAVADAAAVNRILEDREP